MMVNTSRLDKVFKIEKIGEENSQDALVPNDGFTSFFSNFMKKSRIL